MPIRLETGFETGWKVNQPSNPIFCVYFIDVGSGKILFKYGAKLEDIFFWTKYFIDLKKYDDKKLCKAKKDNSDSEDRT